MPFSADPCAALKSAARYVRQFRQKTFVVKVGGELLADPARRKAVCEQLALLWSFSIPLVLVHGGGPGLDALCLKLGLPIEKVAGRRVTTPETLEAAKMAFAGQARTDLLAELQACGVPAMGLSGVDAGLLKAEKRPPVEIDGETVDYGLVGDLVAVDPAPLQHLLDGGFVPVITPLSGNAAGEVFNTNADTVASAIAAALGAEKLLFVLSAPGLLRNLEDPSSLLPQATLEELDALEAKGALKGGMAPKAAAIRKALAGGVKSVHLVSGLQPDALLVEIFTNEGSGTMILPNLTIDEPAAAGVAP